MSLYWFIFHMMINITVPVRHCPLKSHSEYLNVPQLVSLNSHVSSKTLKCPSACVPLTASQLPLFMLLTPLLLIVKPTLANITLIGLPAVRREEITKSNVITVLLFLHLYQV